MPCALSSTSTDNLEVCDEWFWQLHDQNTRIQHLVDREMKKIRDENNILMEALS